MNEISFGKQLKKWRKNTSFSSRQLSEKIGRGSAYISQLERGLIKKPDYRTGHVILKALGFDEEKIEGVLNQFDILSPKQERIQLKQSIDEYPSYDYLFDDYDEVEYAINNVSNVFTAFSSKDYSRARDLILHINALTKDKEKFNFLCELFKYDMSQLVQEDRHELLRLVNNFISSNYAEDDFGDFIKKEKR